MNRREFFGTTAVAALGTVLPIEAKAKTDACPVVRNHDRVEPKLIYDLTTGNNHGQRAFQQVYFYEREMPPVQNRAALTDMLIEDAEYHEWFNTVNIDRPCWAWEDRDHHFDFEKFKSLLDVANKPLVWFPWRRENQINLIFAGHDPHRFDYENGKASSQAWQMFAGGDDKARIWLDGKRFNVTKSLRVTFWTNPGYPITQWMKNVEEHLPPAC